MADKKGDYKMFKKIYEDIQELFKSDVTTYQISKNTGLTQASLDRYRNGAADIRNMKMSVAEKLYEFKDRLNNKP